MNRQYDGKKALIVGGLGFIGSNLAHALVEAGADVTIADCQLPGHGANLFNLHGIEQRVNVHYTDIRDAFGMAALVQNQDVIFNIAAHSSHLDSVKNPLYDLDINARGNLILLEAVCKAGAKSRVVYVGTRAQYGRILHKPVAEEHPMNPLEQYAAHKMLAERYHLIYHHLYGLPVTCLRVNNTYGPRSQMGHARFGVLNWFMRLAIENKQITVHGDGSQYRDYNYIQDVVAALLMAGVDERMNGEVYNLGSDDPRPFRELVELILAAAGQGSYACVPFPHENQVIDVGDFVADITKIKALGWQPKTDYVEGFQRTIEFYREYQKHYW
ncbi:NAD-dependent epimerase/dehydratase family protein [Alicyclobacillus fodiniaquatilis]|uniref:NAD-dependent epimerase/dehydratase family protein n=1 Tax=Alicyclobacillus fodiniaquatilis TaxID=1661150 RepID=A0ABW4JG26_9BACL